MTTTKKGRAKKSVAPIALTEVMAAQVRDVAQRLVNLCVLEVDVGLEEMVADAYIGAALPTQASRAQDGRVVGAESGVWRVEEIDSLIIAPSNQIPVVCNVIVVLGADAMSAAAHDRLLKTLEEPSGRTSFCFLVRDLGAVAPTLLGRAGARATLDDAHGPQRLIELGLDAQLVHAYAPYWGRTIGLIEQHTNPGEVLVAAHAWRRTGARSTGDAFAALLDVSKDTAKRRAARVLCGAWLSAMARSVRESITLGTVGLDEGAAVLSNIDAARINLTYNSPLAIVIARALG
jgi:hypothetical protein